MIKNYEQIEKLFREIYKEIKIKIDVYVIGGAVLLRQELKGATKDIDLIVDSKSQLDELQRVLEKIGFLPKRPSLGYEHLNLDNIFQREDFRIDLFYREVCSKFSLTKDMKKRSIIVQDLEKLRVLHCSNEDIFLFKTMTEREGDLEDCINLGKAGIDWKVILKELQDQIKDSKKDVWITWIGERLDILKERGLEIPIMDKVNDIRSKFFDNLEKKLE